jgi:hypothetical protein
MIVETGSTLVTVEPRVVEEAMRTCNETRGAGGRAGGSWSRVGRAGLRDGWPRALLWLGRVGRGGGHLLDLPEGDDARTGCVEDGCPRAAVWSGWRQVDEMPHSPACKIDDPAAA